MFYKKNRYITRGINEKLDIRLQILLWDLIDSLKEKNQELDYLQVFNIGNKDKEIVIEHSQEVPKYKAKYGLNNDEIIFQGNIKVFVIDDTEHSTMMLAEEY